MRLPQDRILHIDIEYIENKVNVTAEWQGELVRCKDCKHAHMTYGGECKYCDKWEEDGEALYLDGDFFCAYGEKREL